MARAQVYTRGAITTPGADMRRAAVAGFIGSPMEWYDFFLFGTASALVFGKLFFSRAIQSLIVRPV